MVDFPLPILPVRPIFNISELSEYKPTRFFRQLTQS